MSKLKTYFNWSTGKDSALALYYLLQDKKYSVEHLLTSINTTYDRVSMHGLRRTLLEQQVKALSLPCSTLDLPEVPSMPEYEMLMKQAVSKLQRQGFHTAAFGDIFLEDLKRYREQQLASLHIKAVFPLWKKNTTQLLHEFIGLGFKAILVCVNAAVLDPSFAGRVIDEHFLKDLPPDVDACGENGEFHTFCFDGPIFKHPILFETGERIYREYKTPVTNKDSAVAGSAVADKDAAQEQKGRSGFWFYDLFPPGDNE